MAVQGRIQHEYSLIEFLLETELEYIKTYINDQSKLLKIHEQNIQEIIGKETIWIDDRAILPFGLEAQYNSSFFTYNIFYKSTFITLYSFLESIMKETTRIERQKLKLGIGPKDLKGQGVLQYRDYLIKVIQIDFKKLNSLWTKINDARIVRNFLVHDYVDYSERTDFEDMKRISDTNPYVSFNAQDKTVSITDVRYLMDFCTTIELFTNSLLNILKVKN